MNFFINFGGRMRKLKKWELLVGIVESARSVTSVV